MHPETAVWGLTEQLLAMAVDTLRVGNWQRGGDDKAPRPEPLERPGVEANPRRIRMSGPEILARLRAQQRQEVVTDG